MEGSGAPADGWFSGVLTRGPEEVAFIADLRRLAVEWEPLGVNASGSMGVPVAIPMVGVELPHLTAQLRWLWIQMLVTDRGMSIICSWGDATYLDDWGPISGGLETTAESPDDLAQRASDWVESQASRVVLKESWASRRRSRWRFEDDGSVLYDSRRWPKSRRAPDSVVREQALR